MKNKNIFSKKKVVGFWAEQRTMYFCNPETLPKKTLHDGYRPPFLDFPQDCALIIINSIFLKKKVGVENFL